MTRRSTSGAWPTERRAARAERNWAEADRLKAEIEAAGWKIVDRGRAFSLTRAHPPDLEDEGVVRYGWSGSVPSVLGEPASTAATVVRAVPDDAAAVAGVAAGGAPGRARCESPGGRPAHRRPGGRAAQRLARRGGRIECRDPPVEGSSRGPRRRRRTRDGRRSRTAHGCAGGPDRRRRRAPRLDVRGPAPVRSGSPPGTRSRSTGACWRSAGPTTSSAGRWTRRSSTRSGSTSGGR